jgi:small redox-active disulfide protein 2
MNIKVLGPGCVNCRTLQRRTEEALTALHIEAIIEKVEAWEEIAAYGVMRTPGLVIDGNVVVAGFVPPVDKLKDILSAHQSPQ